MLRCQWLKKEYLAFTIVPLGIPNIQSMLFYSTALSASRFEMNVRGNYIFAPSKQQLYNIVIKVGEMAGLVRATMM